MEIITMQHTNYNYMKQIIFQNILSSVAFRKKFVTVNETFF